METASQVQLMRRRIGAAYAQYAQALGRHDASALAALYDEDAVILTPGSSPVVGMAAIRAYCEGLCAVPYDFKISGFTIEHMIVSGEYVIEISCFTNASAPRDDSESHIVTRSKNLMVWRNRLGKWLIVRACMV